MMRMASISLTLPDMHCQGCVGAVGRIVQRLDPAARLSADLAASRVEVEGHIDEAALRAALAKGGFPPA